MHTFGSMETLVINHSTLAYIFLHYSRKNIHILRKRMQKPCRKPINPESSSGSLCSVVLKFHPSIFTRYFGTNNFIMDLSVILCFTHWRKQVWTYSSSGGLNLGRDAILVSVICSFYRSKLLANLQPGGPAGYPTTSIKTRYSSRGPRDTNYHIRSRQWSHWSRLWEKTAFYFYCNV